MKRILASVVGVVAMQGMALATIYELNVQGTVTGAFNGQPLAAASMLAPGLTYYGSTFNATTAGGSDTTPGFAALGGNPHVPPTPNFNNLGSLQLSGTTANYNGNTFRLQVLFTAPPGISGGNPSTYTATLTGIVSNTTNGGIFLDFDNTPQTFSYSNSSQSGTFSLSVNDVSVYPTQVASITGNITSSVAAIPEFSSAIPLGLVLVLVGGVEFARRRRSSDVAEAA
jgi:hypothetical protein